MLANVIIVNFFDLDISQSIILEIMHAIIMIVYLSNCVPIRFDGSSLLPVVGWPPVRAHRKNNLDSTVNLLKFDHEMQESKSDAKRLKSKEMNNEAQSVFVKVKMEGYGVGRKVNLKAHDGYRSLSCALSKLFHNFLSGIYVRLMLYICYSLIICC